MIILIVVEERIGLLNKVLKTKKMGSLNPYCNGRKNRIGSYNTPRQIFTEIVS